MVRRQTALNREFAVRVNGRVAMTVNQRIGWDPAGGQIKSWEFDSEGGPGEGLWARLGDQWIVKATGVLQNGRTATATHIITRGDPSTCRWRTVRPNRGRRRDPNRRRIRHGAARSPAKVEVNRERTQPEQATEEDGS